MPHDAAAAYAVAVKHRESLLDAIARGAVAVPSIERDALLRFAERVRAVEQGADPIVTFDLRPTEDRTSNDDARDIALCMPQSPSEAGAVRARNAHFSASALNTYAECPRKWYFRYVCAAIEDAGSSASTYGTAFHAALEDFHGEFPRPSEDVEPQMRMKIVGYVNWSFERFRSDFETAVEFELHRRRAQRTAQRYIDWIVSESKRAPFTVLGREISAELDLGGFSFIGYIDRVDRDDATGAVSIVDYKTGSIASNAAEYRDKVRTFKDFQLPFYYWARTAAGDNVERLALIPLKDALLDVLPVSVDVGKTITIGELERARERMIEICQGLTSGTTTAFHVTEDPSACGYCAYQNACSDRPHGERERFGR